MPVRSSNNNRILPANARAADVAERAVSTLVQQQQSKTYAAFRVQGFQCLLYQRLKQGRKCSCKGSQKLLGSRLGNDGKAKPGVINELLTGTMTFDVTPYGMGKQLVDPFQMMTSPDAPENKNQGTFDVVAEEPINAPSRVEVEAFGDNGPIGDIDLDAIARDFDINGLGLTDARCPICFGRGFVGGYSALNTSRTVLTVDDVDLGESVIDVTKSPWTASGPGFKFKVVLPLGALGVDAFRVMHNSNQVAANFTVDGQSVNAVSILKFCDGRPHEVSVNMQGSWSHVEIQFALSNQSTYFEFPKLTKGSDTGLLEQLEPFSIMMSPNAPQLAPEDIINETTYGKTLIVQNSNWHNTRARNVLGWECQVRVLQPQEIFNILPKRGRTLTKPPASLGAHDNVTGNRRT